ncbi:V-type ATP synthase subunit E [uncultured archaeon]|nr:V-type ATP synthase subunit E [uncultured archaeon]
MGLEELTAEILHNASEEIAKIDSEAEAEAKRITGEAEAARKTVLENAKKEASSLAESEKSRRIAAARLKARRMVLDEREAVIEKGVANVRERFMATAKSSAYPDLLKRLVEEAVKEAGKGAVIHLNARDKSVLKRVKDATVAEEPENFAGGAIVESGDGRIRIRATLEDLFEERSGNVRKIAENAIFGDAK